MKTCMTSEIQKQTATKLQDLFLGYLESDNPGIIELQNINRQPVAAIYLSSLKYDNFVVSSTNNTERYLLYIDGIAIFFTYFRKFTK